MQSFLELMSGETLSRGDGRKSIPGVGNWLPRPWGWEELGSKSAARPMELERSGWGKDGVCRTGPGRRVGT
jgi:hypothetical protein